MPNLKIIKNIASSKGMTLIYLSCKLGITEAAVQKIIKNNSTKIETLEKIAEILDVPISVFFNEIEQMIQELRSRGFKKTLDRITTFSDKADLYYKEIIRKGNNFKNFIILNHYGKSLDFERQGFDAWLCIYDDEKDIGDKNPLNIISLRHSFRLRDLYILNKMW